MAYYMHALKQWDCKFLCFKRLYFCKIPLEYLLKSKIKNWKIIHVALYYYLIYCMFSYLCCQHGFSHLIITGAIHKILTNET